MYIDGSNISLGNPDLRLVVSNPVPTPKPTLWQRIVALYRKLLY